MNLFAAPLQIYCPFINHLSLCVYTRAHTFLNNHRTMQKSKDLYTIINYYLSFFFKILLNSINSRGFFLFLAIWPLFLQCCSALPPPKSCISIFICETVNDMAWIPLCIWLLLGWHEVVGCPSLVPCCGSYFKFSIKTFYRHYFSHPYLHLRVKVFSLCITERNRSDRTRSGKDHIVNPCSGLRLFLV